MYFHNQFGHTALDRAREKNHSNIVAILEAAMNDNPNNASNTSRYPLHDAAENGDIKSVNRLLSQGKDINEGDDVSDFILVYLLTTTHSVSLLFYYRLVRFH